MTDKQTKKSVTIILDSDQEKQQSIKLNQLKRNYQKSENYQTQNQNAQNIKICNQKINRKVNKNIEKVYTPNLKNVKQLEQNSIQLQKKQKSQQKFKIKNQNQPINEQKKKNKKQVKQQKKQKKQPQQSSINKQKSVSQNKNKQRNSQYHYIQSNLFPKPPVQPLIIYQPNQSYRIPLQIDTTSIMLKHITLKKQPQCIIVSRFKGDKWQMIPGIFNFTIPPMGKYSIKMQATRSRDYSIYLGITLVKSLHAQWHGSIPFPYICFLLNKCAFSQRSNPQIHHQTEVFTTLKKVYTQLQMEIDMDNGEINYYPKFNKNKKLTMRISQYLRKQAIQAHQQMVKKNKLKQTNGINNQLLSQQKQINLSKQSNQLNLSQNQNSQNSINNNNKNETKNKQQRIRGIVPFIAFKYDYDQVRFFH